MISVLVATVFIAIIAIIIVIINITMAKAIFFIIRLLDCEKPILLHRSHSFVKNQFLLHRSSYIACKSNKKSSNSHLLSNI